VDGETNNLITRLKGKLEGDIAEAEGRIGDPGAPAAPGANTEAHDFAERLRISEDRRQIAALDAYSEEQLDMPRHLPTENARCCAASRRNATPEGRGKRNSREGIYSSRVIYAQGRRGSSPFPAPLWGGTKGEFLKRRSLEENRREERIGQRIQGCQ
jgi:hypothetical protein